MKVFVAGIATETNTFSPIPTGLADFSCARSLEDQAEVSGGGVSTIASKCNAYGDEMVHSLIAFAEPAGVTVRPAYETLRAEILADLEQNKDADIVILLLHGAMVADGYDDCEYDLAQKCRDIVGDKAVISAELDLHGHIDERLLSVTDLVMTYKEYPHVDIGEVAGQLYEKSRAIALGEVKPATALVDCKMVGLYSTFRDPVSGFVAEMRAMEQQDGVVAVSFCHGFPWGDVVHMGGKMLVVTDNDQELADKIATDFAAKIYALRDHAKLPSIPMEDALKQALATKSKPAVCADQSDNAGGGAPSDSTFVLRWFLDHGVKNAGIAFFYDPEVVKLAIAAGEGASLSVRLGGKTSPESGDPIDLRVKVIGIKYDYMHIFPQAGGDPVYTSSGDTVALEHDGLFLIVNSSRTQCFSPTAFSDFGIKDLDIYVPKSTNHFMSGFGDMAGDVFYMASPGAIPPIMTMIPFETYNPDGVWPWVD